MRGRQETNFSEIKRHLREYAKHVEECRKASRHWGNRLLDEQIATLTNQINHLLEIVKSAEGVVIRFPGAWRAN